MCLPPSATSAVIGGSLAVARNVISYQSSMQKDVAAKRAWEQKNQFIANQYQQIVNQTNQQQLAANTAYSGKVDTLNKQAARALASGEVSTTARGVTGAAARMSTQDQLAQYADAKQALDYSHKLSDKNYVDRLDAAYDSAQMNLTDYYSNKPNPYMLALSTGLDVASSAYLGYQIGSRFDVASKELDKITNAKHSRAQLINSYAARKTEGLPARGVLKGGGGSVVGVSGGDGVYYNPNYYQPEVDPELQALFSDTAQPDTKPKKTGYKRMLYYLDQYMPHSKPWFHTSNTPKIGADNAIDWYQLNKNDAAWTKWLDDWVGSMSTAEVKPVVRNPYQGHNPKLDSLFNPKTSMVGNLNIKKLVNGRYVIPLDVSVPTAKMPSLTRNPFINNQGNLTEFTSIELDLLKEAYNNGEQSFDQLSELIGLMSEFEPNKLPSLIRNPFVILHPEYKLPTITSSGIPLPALTKNAYIDSKLMPTFNKVFGTEPLASNPNFKSVGHGRYVIPYKMAVDTDSLGRPVKNPFVRSDGSLREFTAPELHVLSDYWRHNKNKFNVMLNYQVLDNKPMQTKSFYNRTTIPMLDSMFATGKTIEGNPSFKLVGNGRYVVPNKIAVKIGKLAPQTRNPFMNHQGELQQFTKQELAVMQQYWQNGADQFESFSKFIELADSPSRPTITRTPYNEGSVKDALDRMFPKLGQPVGKNPFQKVGDNRYVITERALIHINPKDLPHPMRNPFINSDGTLREFSQQEIDLMTTYWKRGSDKFALLMTYFGNDRMVPVQPHRPSDKVSNLFPDKLYQAHTK